MEEITIRSWDLIDLQGISLSYEWNLPNNLLDMFTHCLGTGLNNDQLIYVALAFLRRRHLVVRL